MELGYLYIVISSILMCAMTVVRKEYQRRADATLVSTVAFMGVSSLFICLIGVLYCLVTDFSLIRQMNDGVLGLSVLFSFILTVNTCLCIFGSKYGSLAIISIFANLGTLVISAIYGLLTDPVRNQLNGYKIAGMVLVLIILGLSFLEERGRSNRVEIKKEARHHRAFLIICLLIFCFNGSALPIYSMFSTDYGAYGEINFIVLYLFFCVILCGAVLAVLGLCDKNRAEVKAEMKASVGLIPLLCTLAYGGVFFGSEFLAIKTTVVMPIVVQAPLKFAVQVIIVAAADYLIFKQRISKIQFIQIGLALISGVLFAL